MANKYEIIICSIDEYDKLNEKIEQLNIGSYLSNVVTIENEKYLKNRPVFFDYISNSIKFSDKNKMVLVGHSPEEELLGSLRSGIDTCFVNNNKVGSNVIVPNYEINSYQKIKTIF